MNQKQLEMLAQEQDLSAIDGKLAEEAAQVAVSGYQKIENAVVGGYRKIEQGVVGGYRKMEQGVVEGFGKVVDRCVDVLFAKDGETVEDAKARLSGDNRK